MHTSHLPYISKTLSKSRSEGGETSVASSYGGTTGAPKFTFSTLFFLGLRTTQVSKFWEVGTHAGTFVEESDQLFRLQYCIDQ